MKEHESALKLVDTYLSNARAVKAQMEASYDQMIGGLSGDDRKEAVEMKKVAMENFNATLDEISEMKDIPLDDMKRIIDIKEKEFILDNEVIIRLGPIRGAMQMMGHDTVDKVREVFDAAMKNGMSSDKKQKLTDALGDEELTHGELMEIMEGEDDVVIGEVALNLHKPYLEAVINGSQSAVGPAKASFFSLMDVVDKDSSQASSILPLALKARPALYESMTEEEKGVFDFTLTDSMRGVVGDPQTGLLADISRHPALKNLEVAGLSKEELFVYQSGKLEVNPAIEEFINQNPSVTVMGPSPSQEQIASKNLSALRRDLDKAAKDINTFISEASTLDSPALKGMTPEQRASYLTSLETGNALSAFSNIPSLDLNPQDVQEAIANGKTVKEISE